MTFDDYQKGARRTALYPGKGTFIGLAYVVLGLNGEAGEVAEQVKRILRDDNGRIAEGRLRKLQKELGDVLWYASQVATELETSLSVVAAQNLDKLSTRQAEDKLHGDGSDR